MVKFNFGGIGGQKNPSAEGFPGDGFDERVKGVEPDPNPLVPTENKHTSYSGAAKTPVAVSPPIPADADLSVIVDAWPLLPEPIRAGMLAIVKAARPDDAMSAEHSRSG